MGWLLPVFIDRQSGSLKSNNKENKHDRNASTLQRVRHP